ncbi:MAG TPA: permease-like cell division protein FtsX [Saprospiraceae bacterium]|nr:permease-like cell division protein FtsX [Saprospiraceae bacterium]
MRFRGSTNKKSVNYAVLSNVIVLLLIGLFLLLFFHTNTIVDVVKEKMNIVIEVEDNVSQSEIDQLVTDIKSLPSILPESVIFIPKKNALAYMSSSMEKDLGDLGNPFKDVITYNVKSDEYSEKNLASLAASIKNFPIVKDVFYENIVIDSVKDNLKNISFFILIISLIFVGLSVIIMYNTINLSLYADRFEIKTMEIIGARDGFIRQPYLKLAGKVAFRSFVIAALIIIIVASSAWFYLDGAASVINWFFIIFTFLIMFIFSLVVNLGATISIVNKYLYSDENNLYK